MKREQRGMTLVSFIIVLGVVGVFIYMAMKVVPMYSEYYAVKKALDAMAQESSTANADIAQVKAELVRRLEISYSENVKPENVKLVRKDAGWLMTVDYEVRRPLISNLDIVGHFNAEKEFRRAQ